MKASDITKIEQLYENSLYPKVESKTIKQEIEQVQGFLASIALSIEKFKSNSNIPKELIDVFEDSLENPRQVFDKYFFQKRDDYS